MDKEEIYTLYQTYLGISLEDYDANVKAQLEETINVAYESSKSALNYLEVKTASSDMDKWSRNPVGGMIDLPGSYPGVMMGIDPAYNESDISNVQQIRRTVVDGAELYEILENGVVMRADEIRSAPSSASEVKAYLEGLDAIELMKEQNTHKATKRLIDTLRKHLVDSIKSNVVKLLEGTNETVVAEGILDGFPLPTWMEATSNTGTVVDLDGITKDELKYTLRRKAGNSTPNQSLRFQVVDIDDLASMVEYLIENHITLKNNIKYLNRNKRQ